MGSFSYIEYINKYGFHAEPLWEHIHTCTYIWMFKLKRHHRTHLFSTDQLITMDRDNHFQSRYHTRESDSFLTESYKEG